MQIISIYDEMVLKIFINTIAKPFVKRLNGEAKNKFMFCSKNEFLREQQPSMDNAISVNTKPRQLSWQELK